MVQARFEARLVGAPSPPSSEPTESEAEHAAHVRWADATRMRAQLQECSLSTVEWPTLCRAASQYEAHLLSQPKLKCMVRPLTCEGTVQVCGVSERYGVAVVHHASTSHLYTLTLSERDQLQWRRRARLHFSLSHADVRANEVALVGEEGTLALALLPQCKNVSTHLHFDEKPSLLTFSRRHIVVARDDALEVLRREEGAEPTALRSTTQQRGASVMARVRAAHPISALSLLSTQLMYADEQGNVYAARLLDEFQPSFKVRLQPSLERPLTLSFAGSRVLYTTPHHVACEDRDPVRRVSHWEESESTAVCSLFWGDALVTHEASNAVVVRHFRKGTVVSRTASAEFLKNVPACETTYRSLAISHGELVALLPNASLLMMPLDE